MEKKVLYADSDVVVVPHVDNEDLKKYSLNKYLLMLFVRTGSFCLNLNEQKFTVNAGQIMFLLPQYRMIDFHASADFQGIFMFIKETRVLQNLPSKIKVLNDFFYLANSPILNISNSAKDRLIKYSELLNSLAESMNKGYNREIARCLFDAFLYECLGLIERDEKEEEVRYIKQGERLFKDFVKMLTSDEIKSRSVSTYADRLCITPKYLSSVAKQMSGQTASFWINSAIVKDAKYMLKYTDKSIKEIAMLMEFPNVSFFGKYFKSHVGVSPMEYRRGK